MSTILAPRRAWPLLLPLLLGGCLHDDELVVEYTLRCTDDEAATANACPEWRPVDRSYYRLDPQGQSVSWWVEGATARRYSSCTIYNPENWSCAAEIGMPAVEFKQGRRLQAEADTLARRGVKRVTWFEWWSTYLSRQILG